MIKGTHGFVVDDLILLGVCLPFLVFSLVKLQHFHKRTPFAWMTKHIEEFINCVDIPIWFVDENQLLTFRNFAFQ